MNKRQLEYPKLRRLARGKHCYVGAPECSHDPARTVLCHIRRGGVAGMGQKPHDVLALPGDDICNAIMDGDSPTVWTRDELDAAILKGYVQWLDYLSRQEIVLICI